MSANIPLSLSELERIRLKARKRLPTSGTGSLLRRRLGHSLEFREHRAYQPGDDIRNVDWRASARYGLSTDYLVRAYEAEEQFCLLVGVDIRPTMRLPRDAPKLLFAKWAVLCLAHIAAREDIKAAFVPLYGPAEGRVDFSAGNAILAAADRFMTRLDQAGATSPTSPESLNVSTMVRSLPQSSATILLSDFYMADIAPLITLVREARRGFRQVVLCELDTWPVERALMEGRMVRLLAVGDAAERDGDFEPSPGELDEASRAIEEQISRLRTATRLGGVIHTSWRASAEVDSAEALAGSFRQWFPEFTEACELFGRRG